MLNLLLNSTNEEIQRLAETRVKGTPWKKWGPYLSERQWGTVREDYSVNGNAWDYFTHDQARSRAYHWGEDGLAGYSDDKQHLCFALALWNGADPILKERLFGLSNSESNHGEDVKEYYFYLDSTPTHSYMKYLYKYPQAAYPYDQLVNTNRQRTRNEFEYELIDTGVFDEDRYFDVFVEYAKQSPDDTLIRITVHNRGPEPAALKLLPTLWFRNTWSWTKDAQKPELKETKGPKGAGVVAASHPELGDCFLYGDGEVELLFTENETNNERIFGSPNQTPYVKDSFHNYIIHGANEAVNPGKTGTKAAFLYELAIGAGESQVIRLRLNNLSPAALKAAYPNGDPFGDHFEQVFSMRQRDADAFYAAITPDSIEGTDQAQVMRQALAGLLWTKQYYYFDLDLWLKEHGAHPMINGKSMRIYRNNNWFHMVNNEVISMPDKWEYPWYAAWDLAFHCVTLAMVDISFAKQQLDLMLRDVYLHPSGQIPAYEWNFGDVNPPVHAWATMFVYNIEQELLGEGDVQWLKSCFQKLLMNFTWWVNRKDPSGRNVFEGGFLGLDNIGVFDRSSPLPTGGSLEQADGTAWMALFSQNMLQIALELSLDDSSYGDMALKFVEHFFSIAGAMDRIGDLQDEMWDETDGFFYDLLRLPNGEGMRLKVRSMVGLLPLCAATVIEMRHLDKYPSITERAKKYMDRNPELLANLASPFKTGYGGRRLLAVMDETKLRRVLAKMLDENEFLGPHGIRALSRYHAEHPFTFNVHGEEYRVEYLPAESNTGMFGGNSNWRGPVWMPVNLLIIRSLLNYYSYYGDDFTVECPTGSGKQMTLYEVAQEVSNRLISTFVRDENGHRPVYGGNWKFQNDPYWRDYILFYEYFHGDNGAGLGASHQTGWTAGVARLIQYFSATTSDKTHKGGIRSGAVYLELDEKDT